MAELRSAALDEVPAPDFADVQVVAIPAGRRSLPADPAVWARAVFDVRSAPWPVVALLAVRQAVVGLVGIPRADRDVFAVAEVRAGEALIRADDVHLDFRVGVSVDLDARLLRVVTAVRLHGWRGRVYFVPVSLAHGPITRAMARRAARRIARGRPALLRLVARRRDG